MCKQLSICGATLLAMCFTASASADETASQSQSVASIFSISGFGTIGAVQTNNSLAEYTSGYQAAGATKTANFGPDTKFGAQIDAHFNPNFSATVQAFSRLNAMGTYSPDVEWAFAKAKLGDGFDIRLGRMGAPFYMTSDFRNVGYTNVSVRQPLDVYISAPNRSFDGGDILYQRDFGGTVLNSQLWMGRSATTTQPGITFLLHNIVGLNMSVENGPLTVRFGKMKARLEADGVGLANFNFLTSNLILGSGIPGLESLGQVAKDISVNNKYGSFTGLGAVLDMGKIIINTEITKRKTESAYVQDQTAFYATLGYRVDKFTPYISYSQRTTNSIKQVTPYPTSSIVAFQPLVVKLVDAVNNGVLGDQSDKGTALGVRWDAGKNYDIKAEYQQIRIPAGSSAGFQHFTNVTGKFDSATSVNLISLCVDFVF